MKFIFSFLLTFMLLMAAWVAPAQTVLKPKEDSVLMARGEIIFKFTMTDKSRVDSISRIISIDNYKDGEVYAYANRDQFIKFLTLQIDYTLLPPPSSLLTPEELNMGNLQQSDNAMTIWNTYPTYNQYVTLMNGFASSFPSICHLETIGTTPQGRLILALKISDSVNYDRGVPQVLLTSSIHGDELTGYVLMLHLIDTLLNSYGTSTRLTNIIHNTQLFINPLANPDGTFHTGGATRYNSNSIDLNRNFPDPRAGQNPDGHATQPETSAFMNYAGTHHFALSMNFHGGAEVVNYPWDTWASVSRVTADDSWWQYVAHAYADTVQHFGPSGYFTGTYPNGITEGGDWYIITGGRQDYHNYFRHDREVTLEISVPKTPAATALPGYFRYNIHSFLNYIEEAEYGINGKVVDSLTLSPLRANVFINFHDIDSSNVYSSLPTGWYYRLIDNGNWNVTFSATGYSPRTKGGISSTRKETTRLNIKLMPISYNSPNPFTATAISGSQINLSWTKNAQNYPVLIAISTVNTFGSPDYGIDFTPGFNLPGGGTIIYNGSGTSFSATGLDPNQTYYFQAFSVGPGYICSLPISASATTLCGVTNAFPFYESFTAATVQLPNCWTQEASGSGAVNKWVRSNTSNAGGLAWEMLQTTQAVNPCTTRLKTCYFNTVGVASMVLSFRNRITVGSGTGTVTLKIQSSTDGTTWTDEPGWSATGSLTARTTTLNIVNNLNSATTMIAFVATGNLARLTNWNIDNVSIAAPGFWVGGTPWALTDWNTTTNWGDGVVPAAGTNVYIPQRTYLPVVNNAPVSPALCKDLVISKNATVSIGTGKQITVNGKMTLQGAP